MEMYNEKGQFKWWPFTVEEENRWLEKMQIAFAKEEIKAEGKAEGLAEAKNEMVKNMINHGIDLDTTAKIAELPISKIKEIINS